MIHSYKTVLKPAGPCEIKERSSRFISYCFHVQNVEDVDKILKTLKKKHYDATHICYAYVMGEGEISQFRYNDDGEPSGTAGIPIYNEILRRELFNVVVVSVRYFGGVKLGTGGLSRAYGTSAREVIEIAKIETVSIKTPVLIKASFEMTGIVMNQVNSLEGIEIITNSYDDTGIFMEIMVPIGKVSNFFDEITEKSGGKVSVVKKKEKK